MHDPAPSHASEKCTSSLPTRRPYTRLQRQYAGVTIATIDRYQLFANMLRTKAMRAECRLSVAGKRGVWVENTID